MIRKEVDVKGAGEDGKAGEESNDEWKTHLMTYTPYVVLEHHEATTANKTVKIKSTINFAPNQKNILNNYSWNMKNLLIFFFFERKNETFYIQ